MTSRVVLTPNIATSVVTMLHPSHLSCFSILVMHFANPSPFQIVPFFKVTVILPKRRRGAGTPWRLRSSTRGWNFICRASLNRGQDRRDGAGAHRHWEGTAASAPSVASPAAAERPPAVLSAQPWERTGDHQRSRGGDVRAVLYIFAFVWGVDGSVALLPPSGRRFVPTGFPQRTRRATKLGSP